MSRIRLPFRCILVALSALLSIYVVLLKMMMRDKNGINSSSFLCRAQTQLCMAEEGPAAKKCIHKKEVKHPWLPRGFRNAIATKNPLICVILTTYNVGDYVGQALGSILNQTYPHLDVVVVDDSSSDGTFDEIERYKSLDSRVRAVKLAQNTNGGAGQPSNVGMDSCLRDSEFIMFVDGDDYLEKDAVAVLLAHAKRFDSDLVMADFDSFSVNETSSAVSFVSAYDHTNKWENLPADSPFNILTHPVVLRTSPVPWRKFYKRSFVEEHDLRFPEGDYFYEDNTFHWTVLGHAARVSKVDRVLFHHRTQRKGQTSQAFFENDKKSKDEWWKSYSNAARMSGYFPNLYGIGQMLLTASQSNLKSKCSEVAVYSIVETYFEFLYASKWISKMQKSEEMQNKFNGLFDQHREHWLGHLPSSYKKRLPKEIFQPLAASPKKIDLSLILPTYNVVDLLPELLESIYAGLSRPGFTFEVFAVDDGSCDGTIEVLRLFAEIHSSNFFALISSGNSTLGAGRARNRAIPLVEGRYVYFVDADDSYDFPALADAVDYATNQDIDLLLLPYETEYVTEKNSDFTGMLKRDQRTWDEVHSRWWRPGSQETLKNHALSLINYPWKQLTASRLIRDADIFFGPTKVHNDVQFHWTSIAASRHLRFHREVVCTHRKLDAKVRRQLTEVRSAERRKDLDAITMTQRALARQGAFKDDDGDKIFDQWQKAVKTLIAWAYHRVPQELIPEFNARSKEITRAWNHVKPSALQKWPHVSKRRFDTLFESST